jgi:hypothetical protein
MKKFSKMVQIGEIVSSASTPVSLCGSDYTSTSVNMNSTGGNCLNGNVSGINNGVGNYNVSGHGSGNAL